MEQISIKKNFLYSMIYQVIAFLTPLITAPYIARVLGPDGVGIASFTGSVQTYFSLFAALGTVSYGTREIARARKDVEMRSRLFWELELLTVITTCICLIGWAVLVGMSEEYRIYYLILTMNLLAVVFDVSWFFMGMEEFRYIVLRNTAFRLLGVVAIFLFVREAGDTAVYIAISALSALLGNLSMWVYLPGFVHFVPWQSLRVWRHFRETLVYFVPAISTSVYTVLDKTLLGIMVGEAAENGYYEQAMKIVRMAQSLTFAALNSIMGARMSFLFAEGALAEIHQRIEHSMDYILFVGVGIVFILLGTAADFVPWFFGAGYERVIPLLQMLSPLVLIIGISNCLGSHYYTPAGLRKMSARFIVYGACFNLILNLLLIPRYWSMGAIWATLTAEGTISLLYFRHCGDYLTVQILLRKGWKKIVAGFLMLLAIVGVQSLALSVGIAFLWELVAGSAVYLLGLYIFRDSFISYLWQMLQRRRKKCE